MVCVTDQDIEKAKQTSNECINKSFYFKLDVTQKKEIQNVFNEISGSIGKYEILISNAGVSTMNYIEELTEEEWDFNMNINAKGVFLTKRNIFLKLPLVD